MMKNIFKPILFSTPMVQAILDGNKTQTRRLKKLEIVNDNPDIWEFSGFCPISETNRRRQAIFKAYADTWATANLPYEINDILWVRETWLEYKSFSSKVVEMKNHYKTEHSPLIDPYLKHLKKKWTPSIVMPKRAARIFLKVKNVRVERLNSISKTDAIAEGIERSRWTPGWKHYTEPSQFFSDLSSAPTHSEILSFQSLWMKINGAENLDLNPWVWVFEFEKIDKPLDFC